MHGLRVRQTKGLDCFSGGFPDPSVGRTGCSWYWLVNLPERYTGENKVSWRPRLQSRDKDQGSGRATAGRGVYAVFVNTRAEPSP